MTFAEIIEVALDRGQRLAPMARKVWGRAAYIATGYDGITRIVDRRAAQGIYAPYGFSFEDLMADDWIVVPPEEVGWV